MILKKEKKITPVNVRFAGDFLAVGRNQKLVKEQKKREQVPSRTEQL